MKKLNVAETKLEMEVQEYINSLGWGDKADVTRDLLSQGVNSNTFREIYMNKSFFQRHELEIVQMFAEQYIKKDKFFMEEMNQNLIGWFTFEKTIRKLADSLLKRRIKWIAYN